MRVKLFSGRFDMPLPLPWLTHEATDASIILHTELTDGKQGNEQDRRGSAVKLPGFGMVWDDTELGIQWDKSKWRILSKRVVYLGMMPRVGGGVLRKQLLLAQLQRTNAAHYQPWVAVMHAPVPRVFVPGATKSWDEHMAKAMDTIGQLGGPIIFGADINRDIRRTPERGLVERQLASAQLTIASDDGVSHGKKCIDIVALRGFEDIRCTATIVGAPSDHAGKLVDARRIHLQEEGA